MLLRSRCYHYRPAWSNHKVIISFFLFFPEAENYNKQHSSKNSTTSAIPGSFSTHSQPQTPLGQPEYGSFSKANANTSANGNNSNSYFPSAILASSFGNGMGGDFMGVGEDEVSSLFDVICRHRPQPLARPVPLTIEVLMKTITSRSIASMFCQNR